MKYIYAQKRWYDMVNNRVLGDTEQLETGGVYAQVTCIPNEDGKITDFASLFHSSADTFETIEVSKVPLSHKIVRALESSGITDVESLRGLTMEQLIAFDGIGKSRAQQIIDYLG